LINSKLVVRPESGEIMTENEKMLAGEFYFALDPELVAMRNAARILLDKINATAVEAPGAALPHFKQLFGAVGEGFIAQAPFYCDYGRNIYLGDNVYFNFNCVILDCAKVTIGSNVMFGPNVQIYTATHPLDAAMRKAGKEFAKPITIREQVWVGGSVVICPGVTIGERSVLAAGAVITKDVPPGVLVGGNPATIIKDVE
jgi:maltose O-acetyltransferase